MNFSGKSCKKCLISGKSTTNHRFGQNFATFGTSCHVFAFRWTFQQKVPHFVKKHENLSIWPKLATFRTNYHVLAFRWTIQQKVAKSRSCREKARKIIDFSKTCKFFEQTTMSWRFEDLFSKKYLISWKERKIIDWAKTLQLFEQTTNFWRLRQLLSRKLQKLPHFVKKQEKSATWPKLATFRTKYHVFAFRWTFKEKKVPHFMKKHENSSIWQKTCNFSNKLPCLSISMIIAVKSSKKWLVSWKSTKNHWFGQNFATFRTNYHVFAFRSIFKEKVAKTASFRKKARKLIDLAKTMKLFRTNYHVLEFRWTFQQKVAKSGSIRDKAQKIMDFSKTLQLFEQTTMSLHFDELFRKKLQKAPHFVKKHEKPSIWRKLATFRANYHVLVFSWTFQQKVAKSASFGKKAREIIDLAKTIQLFEQTTMLLHLDELLRKRWEKVVHFVEKHENSWIWSKLATFRENYHVLTFRCTFQEKVAKTASFREKARKLINLAKTMQLLRTNYHVLVFRWTFQPKVQKSGSIHDKAGKIIDLAKTLQLFEQTTMSLHFHELFSKKLQKVPHFVKKHEKPSIWPKVATFRANYHVLAFSWSF